MTDREKVEEIVKDLEVLYDIAQRRSGEEDYPHNSLRLGEARGLCHAIKALKSAFLLGEFDDNTR